MRQCQSRLVPEWTTETRSVQCTENRIERREYKYNVCRPVWEEQDQTYTVMVPHQETTAPPEPHPHLTPRQTQVLHLLSHGRSTQQIADELYLSRDTVRNHVRRMLTALDAHSRIEALAVAHREGILRPQ